MTKLLRYISISHTTANLQQRESYHISDNRASDLTELIKAHYTDVSGLMFLSTCNRMEVYVESSTTNASEIRDFVIKNLTPNVPVQEAAPLFHINNTTTDTAHHLLKVANGLKSAVVGDQQILNQIKKAYQQAVHAGQQGSLLERTLQAVFKSHKRISNESAFRNGSRSTAYRALKIIENQFGKSHLSEKRLLIVGAGDIATETLKYLIKFNFKEVYISNRTHEKANNLAKEYGLKIYPWQQVEANDLAPFDAIITAVSNRKHLIHQVASDNKKVIIDLSLPSNVADSVGNDENISLYNLDHVTEQIEITDKKRKKAIWKAELIILDEMKQLKEWFDKSKVRTFLNTYKAQTAATIEEVLQLNTNLSASEILSLTDVIAQKMVKKPAVMMNHPHYDELADNHMELIEKAFTSKTYY